MIDHPPVGILAPFIVTDWLYNVPGEVAYGLITAAVLAAGGWLLARLRPVREPPVAVAAPAHAAPRHLPRKSATHDPTQTTIVPITGAMIRRTLEDDEDPERFFKTVVRNTQHGRIFKSTHGP